MDTQIVADLFRLLFTLAGGVAAGAFTYGSLLEHEARGKRRRKA